MVTFRWSSFNTNWSGGGRKSPTTCNFPIGPSEYFIFDFIKLPSFPPIPCIIDANNMATVGKPDGHDALADPSQAVIAVFLGAMGHIFRIVVFLSWLLNPWFIVHHRIRPFPRHRTTKNPSCPPRSGSPANLMLQKSLGMSTMEKGQGAAGWLARGSVVVMDIQPQRFSPTDFTFHFLIFPLYWKKWKKHSNLIRSSFRSPN